MTNNKPCKHFVTISIRRKFDIIWCCKQMFKNQLTTILCKHLEIYTRIHSCTKKSFDVCVFILTMSVWHWKFSTERMLFSLHWQIDFVITTSTKCLSSLLQIKSNGLLTVINERKMDIKNFNCFDNVKMIIVFKYHWLFPFLNVSNQNHECAQNQVSWYFSCLRSHCLCCISYPNINYTIDSLLLNF